MRRRSVALTVIAIAAACAATIASAQPYPSKPVRVVVPFAAFRSLAAEREDNTYDLLSITTLRPRQIISGKLGSAVVQMAVYFSAITPCLAFTYLLRGVDVPTIALILAYTFVASLALAMFGLLLATLTQQRYHQVILSVALVALLLWVYYSCAILFYGAEVTRALRADLGLSVEPKSKAVRVQREIVEEANKNGPVTGGVVTKKRGDV